MDNFEMKMILFRILICVNEENWYKHEITKYPIVTNYNKGIILVI